MLRFLPHTGIKALWSKLEETEKASSCQELNPGHLACPAITLPLSYNNWTIGQPPQFSMCTAQVVLKYLSHTLDRHSCITSKNLFIPAWGENPSNHLAWALSWWRGFSSQPLTEFWRHILSGCQVCDWGIQFHLCSTYRGLWGLV